MQRGRERRARERGAAPVEIQGEKVPLFHRRAPGNLPPIHRLKMIDASHVVNEDGADGGIDGVDGDDDG